MAWKGRKVAIELWGTLLAASGQPLERCMDLAQRTVTQATSDGGERAPGPRKGRCLALLVRGRRARSSLTVAQGPERVSNWAATTLGRGAVRPSRRVWPVKGHLGGRCTADGRSVGRSQACLPADFSARCNFASVSLPFSLASTGESVSRPADLHLFSSTWAALHEDLADCQWSVVCEDKHSGSC